MVEISTSILNVNEENCVKTFYNIETAKTDYFHIDVMDGEFVENNNIELMKDYALKISHISNIPLDVHLMCRDVRKSIDEFIDLKPDRITFHIEAVKDKDEAIAIIRYLQENNIKACMAISPDTDIEKIYDFLPYIHMCLVMTVVPGKGGQKLIPEMVEKIKKLNEYININNIDIDIEADGGIDNTNSSVLINSGVNILVSGSYIINSENYHDAIENLRKE